MKKVLLFLVALLCVGGMAFANPAESCAPPDCRPDPKKLKELLDYKIKFLAQEMELRDDQKQKFAALYEKMSEEKRANFESMRAAEMKLKENASEAEYKRLSDMISDCRMRDVQIDKEYDAKFATFLSQKQIYKMKEAEDMFRRKMMEMHQKRKHGRKK